MYDSSPYSLWNANKKAGIILLLLLLSLLPSSFAGAAEHPKSRLLLVTGRVEWKPYLEYNYEKREASGILYDILEYAVQEHGYEISFNPFPWKRAVLLFEENQLDIICGVIWNRRRSVEYNLSSPILTNELRIFVTKPFPMKSLDDLSGKNGDGVRGASYGDRFDAFLVSGKTNFTRLATDANILDRLRKGYSDYFIASKMDALNRIRERGLEGEIVPLPYVVDDVKIHIAFSHAPEKQQLFEKIKKTLDQMKANGTVQHICDTHLQSN